MGESDSVQKCWDSLKTFNEEKIHKIQNTYLLIDGLSSKRISTQTFLKMSSIKVLPPSKNILHVSLGTTSSYGIDDVFWNSYMKRVVHL